MSELIDRLRRKIGDTDNSDPNISDPEMQEILEDSAREYSRVKNIIGFHEIPYDKTENVYTLPLDSFKVKEAYLIFGDVKRKLNFIDNLNEIILLDEPDVESGILKITYNKYFNPEDIDLREIDLFMLQAEGLCYKLMATKTAELIKFSTGEKTIDESGISEKYLELYEKTCKTFRSKAIKAYGKRADNRNENLDYPLPYPTMGEVP